MAMVGPQRSAAEDSDTRRRVEDTLLLMHRWGYAPTISALAHELLGGPVDGRRLADAIASSESMRRVGDFVCLRAWEHLVDPSRRRIVMNGLRNGEARAVAIEFARDLASVCPFVDAIALTGSVASGGYQPGDDIDFDLFVRDGTKYLCYLAATLVGLKYSWRYRRREQDPLHRTPVLPKVTCINVVWPADQTRPFVRRDTAMAFELFRAEPLLGSARFREVLADNPWIRRYFPQAYGRIVVDRVERPSGAMARLLSGIGRRPRLLRALEGASRRVAWVLYHFTQASRARDPRARERMAFLRRVKYPYEMFQD